MEKKYCDTLSKIKADDEFKRDLIVLLEERRQVRTNQIPRRRFMNRHGKRWMVMAAAMLALLACTGVVMAVLRIRFKSGAKRS